MRVIQRRTLLPHLAVSPPSTDEDEGTLGSITAAGTYRARRLASLYHQRRTSTHRRLHVIRSIRRGSDSN
jgi:hypothetical protein